MLSTDQQIIQRMKEAKRVLITCRHDMHVDTLASCLSLYLMFKKLGVPAEIIVSGRPDLLDRCRFLPHSKEVVCDGKSLKNLVIKISPKDGKLRDFRYEVDGDMLKIYVAPASGKLDPADVKAEIGKPSHDLIMVVDTPDLDSLGMLYTEHPDFFYETPIINIDHNPGNEQYGQINFVDITAVSTTEMLYRLLQTLGDEHLDEDVATTLLAGMIAKTESFKAPNVTPRSLMIAAELVQRGARRDEIIHNLYRQHDVTTLRLWGRVLARLQHSDGQRFVWSLVTKEDFVKSETTEKDLVGIIDELIATTPQARTIALLFEKEDGTVGGWLKTDPNYNALDLTKRWQGIGSKTVARFVIPKSDIHEAEKDLIEVVKSIRYS
ncbi:MAG: DHH family phosphoesterase [Patescibacteria group bacterium]|jgi:nanoRNase/pAp phosphatase (c-di-AMP/oligoRNAs hydrolase)